MHKLVEFKEYVEEDGDTMRIEYTAVCSCGWESHKFLYKSSAQLRFRSHEIYLR